MIPGTLFDRIARSMSVGEIATDVDKYDADDYARVVGENSLGSDAGYALVRCGCQRAYVSFDSIPGVPSFDQDSQAWLGDLATPLTTDIIISSSTPLLDLPALFCESDFLFILDKGEINQVVKFVDIDKLPMKLCVFSLIMELESQLLRIIRSVYTSIDSIQQVLPADRYNAIVKQCVDKHGKIFAHKLLTFTNFNDKWMMLVGVQGIGKKLPFEELAMVKRVLKDVTEVRNHIAHGDSILTDFQSPQKFAEFVAGLQSTITILGKISEFGFWDSVSLSSGTVESYKSEYRELSELQQSCICALAFVHGTLPLSADLVRAVCNIDLREAETLLRDLTSTHLLVETEDGQLSFRDETALNFFQLQFASTSSAWQATIRAAYEDHLKKLGKDAQTHVALFNLGSGLAVLGFTKSGEEASRCFTLAIDQFQEALALRNNMAEALFYWGKLVANQGAASSGDEANRLFATASERYQKATEAKPDYQEVFLTWGNTLAYQAGTKSGEEAERLYIQAAEKYQKAWRIKPDMKEALFAWGNALSNQADFKSGEEAERLYIEAAQKYQEALMIDPDWYEAHFGLGKVLTTRAHMKTGAEAETMAEQACTEYDAALRIKSDYGEALLERATLLMERAKTVTGPKMFEFFETVEQDLMAAESVNRGSATYKLACLSALRLRMGDCTKWLERCRKLKRLPSIDEIAHNADFDGLRKSGLFDVILQSFGEVSN